MSRNLEQLAAQLSTARYLDRTAMPLALAASIDALKISRSLIHALATIEQAAWETALNAAEGRATAFAISALAYCDLSDQDYDALNSHIRERVAVRRSLLQEMFPGEVGPVQS